MKNSRDAAKSAYNGADGKTPLSRINSVTGSVNQILSYQKMASDVAAGQWGQVGLGAVATGVDAGLGLLQTSIIDGTIGACDFQCNEGMVASPTSNTIEKALGKVWGCNEQQGEGTWIVSTADEKPTGAKSGQ